MQKINLSISLEEFKGGINRLLSFVQILILKLYPDQDYQVN